MTALNGDLSLDESYNSGLEGCPGACFVVHLNARPQESSWTCEFHVSTETAALNDGEGKKADDDNVSRKELPDCLSICLWTTTLCYGSFLLGLYENFARAGKFKRRLAER